MGQVSNFQGANLYIKEDSRKNSQGNMPRVNYDLLNEVQIDMGGGIMASSAHGSSNDQILDPQHANEP